MRLAITTVAALLLAAATPVAFGPSASAAPTNPDVTKVTVVPPDFGASGLTNMQTVIKGTDLGEYEETLIDVELIKDGTSLGFRRAVQNGGSEYSILWDAKTDGYGEVSIGGLRLTYTPEGATEPVTIEDTAAAEPFLVQAPVRIKPKFDRKRGAKKITVTGTWKVWDPQTEKFGPVAGGTLTVQQIFGDPDPYPNGPPRGYHFKEIGTVEVAPDGTFKAKLPADPQLTYFSVRSPETPVRANTYGENVVYNRDPRTSPGRV